MRTKINPQQLFYKLLKAESESDVEDILNECDLLTDVEDLWRPYGGFENNFSTVGNQHADATGALVDKIINCVDAVLMSKCFENGIDPESLDAPQSMAEAVHRFFNVPGGRLGSLDARSRTALAEECGLHLVAVGAKSRPSYLLIDRGEGQVPTEFANTFLSLNKSNKLRIPFVQGKFNAGGTGVLQFCGSKNFQLIVSRRHPNAPRSGDEPTNDEWGFTIVRRLYPEGGRRSSMFVYLAPGGQIPSFKSGSIRVLPGSSQPNQAPEPYVEPLRHGTCIKLYEYGWTARSTATTDARYALEKYLQSPCLPLRVTETRDYRANSFSTTVSGVWAGMNGNVESDFPGTGELDVAGLGKLPYYVSVFASEIDSRHIPTGVFFLLNGQTHGRLPSSFVRNRLKFDYLSKHLLVAVDCVTMNENAREDFFMASRDRIRQNEKYKELVKQLEIELRNHPGLKRLNAERRLQAINKAISDDDSALAAFREILRSDPALAALFSTGNQFVTPRDPRPPVRFDGERFPSYFQLAKNPKSGLVKGCPIDGSASVVFETDAVNDYFSRSDSPGSLYIEAPKLHAQWRLWNGVFRLTLRPGIDANIGDSITVAVAVSDVHNSMSGQAFESTFEVQIVAERQPQPNPPKPKPKIQVPPIIEVPIANWGDHSPPFTAQESMRILQDGDDNYDFYLNVDNDFLRSEKAQRKSLDNNLIQYWFKYGLTLCGLGMLQKSKVDQSASDETGDAALNGQRSQGIEEINEALNGIARVIVPVVNGLQKNPN